MTEPQQLTLCDILPPAAKESKRWPGIWVTPDGQQIYRRGTLLPRLYWLALPITYDRKGYALLARHRQTRTIDGRTASAIISLHGLVMDVFGPPKPSAKHIIRHLDGDKLNNRIENLAWGTHRENKADAIRHGTASCCLPDWQQRCRDGWRKRKERLEAAKMQER